MEVSDYEMKKRVSVRELKEYCSRNKPQQVLFCTENQEWYRVADPCKIRLSFPIMLICENPNLICLKSETSTMCIDRIKFAEINSDANPLGTILTVSCGNMKAAEAEKTYTLIFS